MNVKRIQFILNISKIAIILLIALFVCNVYASTDRNFEISAEEAAGAALAECQPEGEGAGDDADSEGVPAEGATVGTDVGQEDDGAAGAAGAAGAYGIDARPPAGSEAGTNADFRQAFELDPADFEGVVYYKPASNMDVTELVIAKTSSESLKAKLLESIDRRLKAQESSFEGYAPEQFGLLKSAVVSDKGNFVFYMVSEDADEYYSSFVRALKK